MTNFVQMYKSTDLNAPTLSGTAGDLTTLLDAILINGYTTASVTSIVESGTTYTATLAVANSTLVVGDHIKIAGVDQSSLNDVWAITAITSTTVFTFTGPGSLGSITGTITYRKAPLAWATAFTGTNKRAYRSADTSSNRFYFYVDDSNTLGTGGGAKEAVIYGMEAMTDINTGTAKFPTVNQQAVGLYTLKSTTADATARVWTLIGDDRTFYFFNQATNSAGTSQMTAFGHFPSYCSGDGFNTFIIGNSNTNTATTAYGLTSMAANVSTPSACVGLWLARSFTQIGGSDQNAGFYLSGFGGTGSGAIGSWPNQADSAIWMSPFYIVECTPYQNSIRGRMPGAYGSWHSQASMVNVSQYDQVAGFTGISSHNVVCMQVESSGTPYKFFFDATGPWT